MSPAESFSDGLLAVSLLANRTPADSLSAFSSMAFKDLFSEHAREYARFRPSYPVGLFDWLSQSVESRRRAVDVGAGNGQAAAGLAAYFDSVIAIEPSGAQLDYASPGSSKITYLRGCAEATGLEQASADLMVAAQAFHWFNNQLFFAEVSRVVRAGGTLAVWCYGLAQISPEIDAAIHALYEGRLGPFWQPERRLIEDGYRTVVFPFPELAVPLFRIEVSWTFPQLIGYLSTWSPIESYVKARGDNPLELELPRLEQAWAGAAARTVSWPLSVRAFRI